MAAKRRTLWGRATRLALGVSALLGGYLFFTWLTLPDVRPLATDNPTTTAFMELRVAEARAKGDAKFAIRQRWVPYGQISENLKKAVLKAEDAAFFDHDGIDFNEIKASMERNWEEGKFTRGASTITQQLAKNLYLSPSRNPMRKVKELMITRRLEAALTKRRILEIYLNEIEWGDGIFGCEVAARAYFGKSAKDLTASEAALMAGAIINPREHSPLHPTKRLLRRQQIILRRMQPAPMPQPPNRIEPSPFPLPDPSKPAEELTPPPATTTVTPGDGRR
jgi:monofunctional biosynthetic peptidoglycan transglycosylase